MADANSTATRESTHLSISNDLNGIGARLSGVTDMLRRMAEDDEGGVGNILHLMADITDEANRAICDNAGRVSALTKGGA